MKIFSVYFDIVFGIMNTFIQLHAFLNNSENVIYSKCPLSYNRKLNITSLSKDGERKK